MSLTQTARNTRKAVTLSIILLIVLATGKVAWGVAVTVYQNYFPPEEALPETGFGKIPPQNIPGLEIEGENVAYTLETPTGRLPDLPSQLPVFPIKRVSTTPLKSQRAQELAAQLGFSSPPKILSSSSQRFIAEAKSMEINIVSLNFSLDTDLSILGKSLSPGSAPPEERAKTEATGFLDRLNLPSPTANRSQKTTSYLKIENGQLREAGSLSDAHLTRVDIIKQLDVSGQSYPILGPNPKEGSIWVAISQQQGEWLGRFPLAKYQNWEAEEDRGSTYPLETPEQIWRRLLAGEGRVTYLKKQGADPHESFSLPQPESVHIYKAYLAYFESPQPQKYLAPIFVFEGLIGTGNRERWDCVVYLPAVTEEWFENGARPGE